MRKGISIIAFVIIIIVLIIISFTVIINLNETTLIDKAQNSVIEWEIISIREKIQNDILSHQIENKGIITLEGLKVILNKYGVIEYEEDGITMKSIITNKNYEIMLRDIVPEVIYAENCIQLPNGWNRGKIADVIINIIDEKEYNVPIPIGFVVSGAEDESKVENGLVIYQMSKTQKDNIDWLDAMQLEYARQEYNQYVWIPIDNPNDIYGMDINGNKLGKVYNFTSNDNVTPLNWTETDGIMKWTSQTGVREPAVVTSDNANGVMIDNIRYEFDNTIRSIVQYNGFYVGRYETGGFNAEQAVVKKGQIGSDSWIRGTGSINNATWYEMYEKSKTLSTESVTVGMIWGSQLDQVIKYARCAKSTTPIKNVSNVKTGNCATDMYKNIYDLVGNVTEWVLETNGKNFHTMRGSHYNDGKLQACYRFFVYGDPKTSGNYDGSRTILCIN